jgi:TATA-box binding protein (TBP) (component of TFIID and TFIIIB)
MGISELDFTKLPEGVTISTMTVTCKLGSIIYLENVSKYFDNEKIKLTWDDKKKNKKKKKKVRTNFFNQKTVKIVPTENKHINVKIFKNGSVQMTGCKNINNSYEVINILLNELKNEKALLENGKIIEKPYTEHQDNLQISDFKIVMINSNFKVLYSIDREVLYDILLEKDILCTYEPCIHACVNIKYKYDENKKISIFVFQSGSIIITGANNVLHIIAAYNFIMDILNNNKDKIVKKNLEDLLNNSKKIDAYIKKNGLEFSNKI